MKPEKAAKAPHVLLVSKRFNEVRVSIFIGKILMSNIRSQSSTFI